MAKQNMKYMPKKKFKDSAVGKFILSKVPDFVSGVLPDKGVLGIVKILLILIQRLAQRKRLNITKSWLSYMN